MNRFLKWSVKKEIKLSHSAPEIWKVVSSPSNLELFHPFCKTNEVVYWGNFNRRIDKLIYLNGLTYFRDFYHWEKNKGYGTKEHRESIIVNGNSKYHRKTFGTCKEAKNN